MGIFYVVFLLVSSILFSIIMRSDRIIVDEWIPK